MAVNRQAMHKKLVRILLNADIDMREDPKLYWGTRLCKNFADIIRSATDGQIIEALNCILVNEWDQSELLMNPDLISSVPEKQWRPERHARKARNKND